MPGAVESSAKTVAGAWVSGAMGKVGLRKDGESVSRRATDGRNAGAPRNGELPYVPTKVSHIKRTDRL